jgi:trimeric autotransporter adhesin
MQASLGHRPKESDCPNNEALKARLNSFLPRRFKEGIKPMERASEALFALKPVTFHYKKEIDSDRKWQFGLVAEEVEKVNADLVVRDKEGKPYSVRYDQVNAMLLNEFLKEHRAFVEEQQKAAQQQKEIDLLKAELKEQRSLYPKGERPN